MTNTRQNSVSAKILHPYLLDCGYASSELVENFELARDYKIPLTAFSHAPHDSRSACIAVIDKISDIESDVKACRSIGAPVVFVREQTDWHFWEQGADRPKFREKIPETHLSKFFKKIKKELAPESIYRAKTWGRLDTSYQLDFVDIGLMPLIEEEAGKKLADLIVRVVINTKKYLGWGNDISTGQGEWLLKSNFWLLAAKILKDKKVPKFINLNLAVPEEVFRRVAEHYGSETPVQTGEQQQVNALLESATEISRFSNLSLVSTEALAYLYENALITKETRIALGTHSTPSYLVDYIIGRLRPWIEEIPEDQRRVFEPACGHSAFLVAAMRLLGDLLSENSFTPREKHNYFKKMLRGADVDLFALELARLNLTLADVPNANGWKLTNVDIFKSDLLEQYANEASIILANPPFADFKPKDRDFYSSNPIKHNNKAAEVLWRVVSNMQPGSVFGFVLPQGVLRGKNEIELRKFIAANFEISEISLFPDKVFTFSDAESTVILGRKLSVGQNKLKPLLYRRIREKGIINFKNTYEADYEKAVSLSGLLVQSDTSFYMPELQSIWDFCREFSTLGNIAVVEKGLEYRSLNDSLFPNGEITFSSEPVEGMVKGFVKMRESLQTHLLPDSQWMNLKLSVIRRKGGGITSRIPQVLLNHARVSRDAWRLKAFIDKEGHPVTGSFLVIRPENNNWLLETLWAICNSPFANVYSLVFSDKRHILAGVMRKMPVPKVEADDIVTLNNLVQAYFKAVNEYEKRLLKSPDDLDELRILHWRIDAEVLKLYGLPPHLERKLLDMFSGIKRRGVPFEQTEYFPEHFKEDITLSDLLAITADWEITNQRRAELIIKEVEESISQEEQVELDNLQRLTDARIELLAPLPIQKLEKISEQLKMR